MMSHRSAVLLFLFLAALALAHAVRHAPDSSAPVSGEAPLGAEMAAQVFPGTVATRLAAGGGWTLCLDTEGIAWEPWPPAGPTWMAFSAMAGRSPC